MCTSNQVTYTRQGMTLAVTSDWFKGQKIYTKKNMTVDQIRNYKLMESLGVGVKLLGVDEKGGVIEMEGGHTVMAVLDKKIVGPVGKKQLWEELMKIRQVLRSHNLAHTDIKPANVAVKYYNTELTSLKVFLIDNDYISGYGKIRQVGTPGINANW